MEDTLVGSAPETSASAPGTRKAAILLLSLGDEASAEIIRQLSDAEIRKITLEITRLGAVPTSEAEVVLDEFYQAVAIARTQGGPQRAQKMLEQALGTEPARRVLDGICRTTADDGLRALQEADPRQLATFIQNEHPQTIALILANQSSAQAATVLAALPQETRAAVVRRIGKLEEVSPDVLNRLAKVMGDNFRSFGKMQSKISAGPRAVAELLNQMEPAEGEAVLRTLTEMDEPLAESIRDLMFVFEDLLHIDKEGIKVLLGAVDRKALTIALKGTSEEMKQHFLQCMSQRGAAMLREDMEAMGAVRLRDVDAARKEIVGAVKKLQEQGTLSLKGGETDQYVE